MTILSPTDYKTNRWSGGTTAQIYIAPKGSTLAARDFHLRLSMATIESEHSTFTPYKGYDRLLCVLTEPIELQLNGETFRLSPAQVLRFQGEDHVHSTGRTTDFGVIYRRGLSLDLTFEQGDIQGPCILFDPLVRQTVLLEAGEPFNCAQAIVLRGDIG